MKAVLTSLKRPFCQYLAHVSSHAKSPHNHCLAVLCKFLGILGKRVVFFFSKDRINRGNYEMLKI